MATLDLFVGAGRSKFTPYLPPHSAATVIQHSYRSYVSVKYPMRALLALINASMACSKALSKAYQAELDAQIACFNANQAKFDARMARLDAYLGLGNHVG